MKDFMTLHPVVTQLKHLYIKSSRVTPCGNNSVPKTLYLHDGSTRELEDY